MHDTAIPGARADKRLFGIVIGWAALTLTARLFYFFVVEPQLGPSTYVYLSGRGSIEGFTLATPDWTRLLWMLAALNLLAATITVVSTLLTNTYRVLATVGGLMLAGASVAFMVSQGLFFVLEVSVDPGDLIAGFAILGGIAAALFSVLFLPPAARKIFGRKRSR